MKGNGHKGAVILGGDIGGLIALRALAASGIPVALIVDKERDFASYSRWARDRHVLPAFHERPEALFELLERRARQWRGWALLPMSDVTLELLSRNLDRLAGSYAVAAPPYDVARRLLSKDLTYAAAREVGVDLPRVHGPAVPETAAGEGVDYPVLVKPFDSASFRRRFGQKLFVANDRPALHRAIGDLQGASLAGEVQELIPGADSAFYNFSVFFDRRGEPVAELGMHKLRKNPPHFGVCRVGEAAELPELRAPTIELLRRIGWHGMANAEYKRDPRDGRYRLMEVNGRGFNMQGLAWRAGVNYPLLAYQDAVLGRTEPAAWNGWDGVWIDLLPDIKFGLFYRGAEGLTIGDYLASYRRPKAFAVWSLSDPGPFLARCRDPLRRAGRLGLSRSARNRLRGKVDRVDRDNAAVRRSPAATSKNGPPGG